MNARCASLWRSSAAALYPLVLVVSLGACEEVTGGGTATFELLVQPDGSEAPALPEGTVAVTLSAALEATAGLPIGITAGERELTLDLLQPTPEEVSEISVFGGMYQDAWVRFSGVRAIVPGEGPEAAPVEVVVDFGEESALVKRYGSQIVARDGETRAVTVDLRASEWLAEAEDGPNGERVVPAQAFLDAVRITVQVR